MISGRVIAVFSSSVCCLHLIKCFAVSVRVRNEAIVIVADTGKRLKPSSALEIKVKPGKSTSTAGCLVRHNHTYYVLCCALVYFQPV
uniref:Putative secreted protein n=1 Tax=Anopheles darlingi TaxID=43151 RepID=A0A2M4DJM8_ANODA